MLRFLADENFDGRILRGVRRAAPHIDIVRAQDVGLKSTPDPTVLAWAADADRLLLTHDVRTIPLYAKERVEAGGYMPGVIEVPTEVPIGIAIDDIILLAEASLSDEWLDQVVYLPLK